MAKKKDNFKDMKGGELEKKLSALREELRAIHFKAEGSRSKNVKEQAVLKKSIARVLTEMNKSNTKNK
jgi:ribosomal protein L29